MKNKVIEYVMNSPGNTNRAVLESLLGAVNGGAPITDDFIISWTGDAEGRDAIPIVGRYYFVKVSDEILTAEQMVGATLIFYENESHYVSVTKDNVISKDGLVGILSDNSKIPPIITGKAGTYGNAVLPSDGTYFFAYVNDGIAYAHTVAIYKFVSDSDDSKIPRAMFFGKGGGNTMIYSAAEGDEVVIIYKLSDLKPTVEDWEKCVCVMIAEGNYHAFPITDVVGDESSVMASAEGLERNNILGLQTIFKPFFGEGLLIEPCTAIVMVDSVNPETFAEGEGIYFFFR